MPQPIQNSLVQVLLLWTTVLSIFQIVVIALFFAGGHNGLVRPLQIHTHSVELTSESIAISA